MPRSSTGKCRGRTGTERTSPVSIGPVSRPSAARDFRGTSHEKKVGRLGKYFGRQPRYSQEEAEAQARQAIDAAVSKGRPPADEWRGLEGRMGEINQELATRPRVDLPPPPPRQGERRPVRQVLRLQPEAEPELAPEPEPAPAPPVRKAAVKRAAVKKAPAATKAPATAKAAAKAPIVKGAAKAPARKKAVPPAPAAAPPAKKRATAKKRST